MDIKPGIKTSEFWLTLLPTVIAFGVLTGYVGEGDTTELVAMVKDVIAGVVALGSIVSYIMSRLAIKQEGLMRSRLSVSLPKGTEKVVETNVG